MSVIRKLKQISVHYSLTLPIFSLVHPSRTFQVLIPAQGGWQIRKPFKKKSFTVPSLHDSLLGNQRNYGEYMREKYTCEGFVEVEKGDTVVDVGAFVGGFSFGVEALADRVLAIEPVETNANCLRSNVGPNVDVAEYAIWEEVGSISLMISSHPQDHSVFDNSRQGRTTISDEVEVETTRLDSLLKKRDYGDVDLLKVEGEGAEPEALRSLGSIRPPKITVSCGEEREEENTLEETIRILTEFGYEIKTDRNIVYARYIT
jgi:FkbM family methyltransferase